MRVSDGCVRTRWPAQVGRIRRLVLGCVGPLDGSYSDAAPGPVRCQSQNSDALSAPKWWSLEKATNPPNDLPELGLLEWFLETGAGSSRVFGIQVPRGNDDLHLSIDGHELLQNKAPMDVGKLEVQ